MWCTNAYILCYNNIVIFFELERTRLDDNRFFSFLDLRVSRGATYLLLLFFYYIIYIIIKYDCILWWYIPAVFVCQISRISGIKIMLHNWYENTSRYHRGGGIHTDILSYCSTHDNAILYIIYYYIIIIVSYALGGTRIYYLKLFISTTVRAWSIR